ncbi:MAG: hypothetical protein MJE63_12805 [Proteobacteria bacterium]|nr:hypothetical protein [Pseudomonadota bacterium]
MKKLLHILFNQSLTDLFKYKSFFLLIFVLILADRLLKYLSKSKQLTFSLPKFETLSIQVAEYLFDEFPIVLMDWITDYRTLLVMVVLFLFKQLISMWPSSDMRRMHRDERGTFGLAASLLVIQGKQVLWDALAVGTMVLLTGLWILGAYLCGMYAWNQHQAVYSLFLFVGIAGLILPITMAGFSFSSKLAVISKGNFKEKLGLFFQLLLSGRVFVGAWLFFTFRIAVEVVFVVILPVLVLWTMDNPVLRIAIAGAIATPFYSFLKMASFKFFLLIYKPYSLVESEYKTYYRSF